MLDLLIRDGLVIDGTGNPGFYATIGVADERVTVLRGDLSSVSAARVIDASGHIVCPGFIDMHAHDASLTRRLATIRKVPARRDRRAPRGGPRPSA